MVKRWRSSPFKVDMKKFQIGCRLCRSEPEGVHRYGSSGELRCKMRRSWNFFYLIKMRLANPRKLKKPNTSVAVVSKTVEPTAGSMFIRFSINGIKAPNIPLMLKRMNIDPAVGSTVLLTTATDVFGFLSFLGLASLILIK